jgi:alkaline phosphatase
LRSGVKEGVSVPKTVRGTRVAVALSALIAALALLAETGEAQVAGSAGERAKNVIIFIGDGMGTSHRDLIR